MDTDQSLSRHFSECYISINILNVHWLQFVFFPLECTLRVNRIFEGHLLCEQLSANLITHQTVRDCVHCIQKHCVFVATPSILRSMFEISYFVNWNDIEKMTRNRAAIRWSHRLTSTIRRRNYRRVCILSVHYDALSNHNFVSTVWPQYCRSLFLFFSFRFLSLCINAMARSVKLWILSFTLNLYGILHSK